MSDKVKAKPFRQVVDTRGRKIAGIFQRGARYYGRLMVEEKGRMVSRRFPLIDPAGQPVRSPSEAREALELLKDARRRDSLPQANVRPPGYAEWIENFLKSPLRNKRKEWSNYTQQIALGRLGRFFGDTPLNKISATRVREYCEARLAGTLPGEKKLGPVKTQTVNFDLNALRCSLRAAVESGRLQAIPEFKSLEEEKTEDKRLITDAEFARLLEGCAVCRNRILVGFYLRFLRASGCREKEALRVRWEGVDFSGGRVRIGQDGQTKNGQARSVDMNPAVAGFTGGNEGRLARSQCLVVSQFPEKGGTGLSGQNPKSLLLSRANCGGIALGRISPFAPLLCFALYHVRRGRHDNCRLVGPSRWRHACIEGVWAPERRAQAPNVRQSHIRMRRRIIVERCGGSNAPPNQLAIRKFV